MSIWPGMQRRSPSRFTSDNSITIIDDGRGIPGQNARVRHSDARGRDDQAARRRQVRLQLLQGLGRPARRRRQLRQRPCGILEARDLARRPYLGARVLSRRQEDRSREGPATPRKHGTKVTFRPDDTILHHDRVQARRALDAAARDGLLERGPQNRLHRRARGARSPGLPLRGRHRRVRQVSGSREVAAAPRAVPLSWEPTSVPTARFRSRSPCSTTTATKRRSSRSPTRSTPSTAARTWPLPLRAHAHHQRLRPERRAVQESEDQPLGRRRS